MSKPIVEWKNDDVSYLDVALPKHHAIKTLADLSSLLRENYATMNLDVIELLGALALFLSVRDLGPRLQPILRDAEKQLDTNSFNFPNAIGHTRFQAGIEGLRQYLFGIRSEPHDKIMQAALNYMQSKVSDINKRDV